MSRFSSLNWLRIGVALFTLTLTACGGGGGTPISAGTAQGLWDGSTSTGRSIVGVVLSDGSYYFLYSLTTNPSVIAGVVQGTMSAADGTFTSNNTRDFNLATEGFGTIAGTVSGTYQQKNSFNGQINSAFPTVFFSGTYNTDYELTPSLADLAGTYTGSIGTTVGVENGTITVTAGGAVSGVGASGCTASGTVTPRTDGNVFDLTLTFNGGVCLLGAQTVSGIAYYDAANKRIYGGTPNPARTDVVIFVGTKP